MPRKVQKLFCLLLLLTPLVSQGQFFLNQPESIVLDSSHNRYLVSNWGNGTIVQIDSSGTQSYFNTDFQNQLQIAGLYLFGDTVLAASGNGPNAGITGFDVNTDSMIFHIPLPGIGLPNDIAMDPSGAIYVTDYWGDKLYRIVNHFPSIVFGQGQGLGNPNGIMYDERYHRLLIISVSGPGAPILQINLEDTTLSTLVTTGIGGTDGIAMDFDRNMYISDWNLDGIYMYDSTFTNPPQVFSTGHLDPADIYFDRVNSILCVPNFSRNTVDFLPMASSSIEVRKTDVVPQKMELFPNYPNPFNFMTTISYALSGNCMVRLQVFDATGRHIVSLISGFQAPGVYAVMFDGTKLASGSYFYQLMTEEFSVVHKMVLLK
jgi:hypothetical protein